LVTSFPNIIYVRIGFFVMLQADHTCTVAHMQLRHWKSMQEELMQDSIDTTYRVTADELKQFIERIERLNAEKKDIDDQQKEVLAEAKGRGYDIKVIRKLITLRRRDQGQVAEEEAVLELYKEALGMS
tara:strand:+ start:3971 stop:4354 length:384 start_codon:yes stop_codon:yes gene_type:complete